ncbi:unnamed protein product, partial [Cuscuta europaea]
MKGEDEKKKIITSKSQRKWVVERGVRLGRNVIVTALFVSSAPLVLPPLIAISVVGFVVWVPVGVVVGSYAATEKLMSKLLPMPSSPSRPLLLEGCHRAATQVSADEDLARRDSEGSGEYTGYEETKTSGEEVEGGGTFVEGCEERSDFVGKEENSMNRDGQVLVEEEGDYKADEVFQHLEGKHEKDNTTNVVDENLVVEFWQDVNANENMDIGYDVEDGSEYSKGELEDKRQELEDAGNIDEHSEKEDEEDACECTVGDGKGNAIDVISEEEGYMEEVGENFLEGEHEDGKGDENLEKGYEEADVGESLEGEGDGKGIITIMDEDLKERYAKEDGEPLDGQNEDGIKDEILEKTCYDEEDVGESVEEEHDKEKEANTYEYMKKEGCDTKEVTTSVSLKEEYHVKDISKNLDGEQDVDSEKGYEDDVDECLEEDQGDVEEIPIERDVKEEEEEDYMEEVDEYSDTKDENLEKDYKEHDVEYLEVEQGIGEVIRIDETLEKGYEGEEEEYLEVEQGDGKEISTDDYMESGYEEEDEEYLEAEQGDGKVITIAETLDKGYRGEEDEEHVKGGEEGHEIEITNDLNLKEDEEDIGKRLEGELEGNKEIGNDHILKDESYGEEAIRQYFEGEEPEDLPATEMKIEGLLDVVARRGSENNNGDNKVGNSEGDESFEGKSVSLLDKKHLEKSNEFEEEDAKMERSEEPAEPIPAQDEITPETKKQIAGEDLKQHHVKKDQFLLINEENHVQEGVSSSTEEPQQKDSEPSIDETETTTANKSTTVSGK